MLSAEEVEATFLTCLFSAEDASNPQATESAVKVEGIVTNVGFDPKRLESQRDKIEAMLRELPDEFRVGGGGGWSFLNACNDRHGHLWTGMHRSMEQLFQLGIAIGKAKWLLPREMWSSLPGGMPYVSVGPF